MTLHKDHKELIVYTDGHGVTITDRNFYTEDQTFLIEGITDIQLIRKQAAIWPVVLFFLLGLTSMLAGAYEMLADWRLTISDTAYVIDSNTVLLISGVVLIVLSIIIFITTSDRYAVGIRTAEGLREPVKSTKREYAEHLVHVLQSSYREHVIPNRDRITPVVH